MIFQPLNLIYSRLSCNQPLNKPFDQAAESQSSGFNVPYFFFVFISHVRTVSFIFLSSSSLSHWTLCLASLPLSLSLSGLNASLSSVRQFWTPSILVLAVSAAQSRERASHLRADRWCRRQLVDGFGFFYCPSLFSLPHFSETFFLFYSVSSRHIYVNLFADFFIFSFLSVRFHRLNVIFSKFDEVQRSGNMISSSGSGEF